ncbi:MAG: fused MFS/spermidine synthase [Gemmataceae bacterium]|nr:fused MFS/spermidine synthase [Gemmataceae bacterium]
MPYQFAITLFVSAALLFCVEPMIAKMILPLLGGSAAVWTTCMVFFQAALLAGYLYAHALSTSFTPRIQVVIHLVFLALAFLVLPIDLSRNLLIDDLPRDADPAPWVLGLLLFSVGLPFVALSASAPLLQKWYGATDDPQAGDPYFLYAASNLGSMIALLGYPLLLEPTLSLEEQSEFWAIGYGVLLALTAGCAVLGYTRVSTTVRGETPAVEADSGLRLFRRLRWVVLAFVPSSLLLGVTTYITTDIASIPLLWVIPLALYLLSFILVFARRQVLSHDFMVKALPVVALVTAFTLLRGAPLWQTIPLHWLSLFVAAMVCHGELARDRPPARYLTEFYLWLSVGGVLGGLFNAIVAPLIFQGRVLEYPLVLMLACLMRPGPSLRESTSLQRWLDLLLPVAVGALCLSLVVGLDSLEAKPRADLRALVYGTAAVACFLLMKRPLRFTLALGLALLTLSLASPGGGRTLYSERNFFGLIRVQEDRENTFHFLYHGSTLHGLQRLDAKGRPDPASEPLSYFHRRGPMGQLIRLFDSRCDESIDGGKLPPRVAVAGLGVGALAGYARPGEDWTFYEIDPAIERVAWDPKFFTYLAGARQRGAHVEVLLGDARLRLRDAQGPLGLIILDAFSSDAVPMHLISRQALAMYREKLAPGGLLAFNITNRYLDLRPALADLANDAGMVCYSRDDTTQGVSEDDLEAGRIPSHWVVMADRVEDLGPLAEDRRWKPLRPRRSARVWTDDFGNLLGVFKWR